MKIERIVGGSLEANCYIVYVANGGGAYVIDPGYDTKRTRDFVREHGLSVKAVLLTHTHSDHAGKAKEIADAFACDIRAHREELDYYKGRVDSVFEGGETLCFDGGATGAGAVATASAGADTAVAGAGATGAGDGLKVLHTPGHTAGGVCYYSEKSKVAFTGDTIFNVDLGYTHFAGGSAERMRKSLKDVVDKWGNEVKIYPGHGDPATMKYVREVNVEFLEMVG